MRARLAQRTALIVAFGAASLAGACSGGGGTSNAGGGTAPTAQAASLASANGTNIAGCATAVVPDTPVVVVRNGSGALMPGATVNFAVTAGGGAVSATSRTTNSFGQAGVSWTLGATGPQAMAATVALLPAVTYSATLTSTGPYCVELVYTTTPDPVLRVAAENAAARWSAVVSGAVPPQPLNEAAFTCATVAIPPVQRTVKSLVIYVELAPIPSSTPGLITLGQAGPCWIRDIGGLTVIGAMKLNSDYLINNLSATAREDVVLHEMGHVLGFGTLWVPTPGVTGMPTLLQNPAPGGSPIFVGASAVAKYVLAGGSGATTIPVENCGSGGTINGHWREASGGSTATTGFGIELMTGYISAPAGQHNPRSAVTIAAMGDLGYPVSFGTADAYTAAGQTCPAPLLYAPGQQPSGVVRVGHDWVAEGLVKPMGVVGRDGRARPVYR